MGKAARNRRNRQRQSRATERLKKRGSTGYLRGDSAEARELFAQVSAETEMPCRATFLDDPLFDGRPARVTGTTPEGELLTDTSREAGRMPVLLFEPVHVIALKDPVTGLTHEARTDVLVGAGWQRVPAQFLMAGLPADGWGLYRTASGVELATRTAASSPRAGWPLTQSGYPPPSAFARSWSSSGPDLASVSRPAGHQSLTLPGPGPSNSGRAGRTACWPPPL